MNSCKIRKQIFRFYYSVFFFRVSGVLVSVSSDPQAPSFQGYKKDDPLKRVPTAVKSALTRQMTKDAKVRDWEPPKPKAKAAKGKKKQAKAPAKKRQKK